MVHFSDINPTAVKNSKLNSIFLDIDNATFSCGNLFRNLPANSKFDVIIFNSPTISGLPLNPAESAFICEDTIKFKFYEYFPKYLNKNGFVIMPGSTRFDGHISPQNLAKQYNYKTHILNKEYEEDENYKYIISIEKSSF